MANKNGPSKGLTTETSVAHTISPWRDGRAFLIRSVSTQRSRVFSSTLRSLVRFMLYFAGTGVLRCLLPPRWAAFVTRFSLRPTRVTRDRRGRRSDTRKIFPSLRRLAVTFGRSLTSPLRLQCQTTVNAATPGNKQLPLQRSTILKTFLWALYRGRIISKVRK